MADARRLAVALAIALIAMPVSAQQQAASDTTRSANRAAQSAMAVDEAREAAEDAAAARGRVAQIADGLITGANGTPIWDWRSFAFLNSATAPDTVNPRLWRQARRHAQHGLFEVVPGAIWQVRGYDISVMTVIRGTRGWIIIDPLTTEEAARAAFALVQRTLGERPVTAVLYTHSHADHFGGVGGIIADANAAGVRIIAPHGFAREAIAENVLAGPAMNRRAEYMFGTRLAPGPMGQVDTGLGPRLAGGTTGYRAPTETVPAEGATLTVDGVELQFLDAAQTEAPAEFIFYIPRYRALHMAEVATKTLHNLLTLRGAQVRDALVWSRVIDAAQQRWGGDAEVALASHGWPTFGGGDVRTWLAGQRDIYRFIHDRTLGAANRGATIQELPDALDTVSGFAVDPSARGYYGTVNHDAKAVYQRYFGWWDGVPANYNPVPPEEAARGYVALAGGAERMLAAAREAFMAGNDRWAAELANRLVFAQPEHAPAKALLADIYEQMGYRAESGAWRNYYLAAAATLRATDTVNLAPRTQSPDYIAAIPTLDLFDSLATRLSGATAVAQPQYFRFAFPDRNEVVTIERRGVIEIPRMGEPPVAATASVTLTRQDFAALLTGRVRFPELMASGQLRLEGDLPALQAWLQSHTPPDPRFNVVVP